MRLKENFYTITNKFGRTGNNIYQLLEIMRQAEIANNKINIDKLNYLDEIINLKKLVDLFNRNKESKVEKINDFFPKNLHLPAKRVINVHDYFLLSEKYIKPCLKLKEKLSSNIAVIHIRSGDEFSSFNRPSNYIQPPLAYYQFIIDNIEKDYEQFIIITEPDMRNPVINKLKEYNEKIKIISNSVLEDYSLLLRAETLILSRSSFSDTSVFLSPNLKNLYFWSYNHCLMDTTVIPKNINFKCIELTERYTTSEEWRSSKEQRELMLTYEKVNCKFKDKEKEKEKEKILLVFTNRSMENNWGSLASIRDKLINPLKKHYTLDIAVVTSIEYNNEYDNILGKAKYKILYEKPVISKMCKLLENINYDDYNWYIKIRPEITLLENIDINTIKKCCINSVNGRVRHYFGPYINMKNAVSIPNHQIRSCQNSNINIKDWNRNDFKYKKEVSLAPCSLIYIFSNLVAKKFTDIDVKKIEGENMSHGVKDHLIREINGQHEGFHGAYFKYNNINYNIIGLNFKLRGSNTAGDLIITERTKKIEETTDINWIPW